MARRRGNIDITADILQTARNGAKKTHIVYRANLNFKLLQKYLDELEEAGLVTNHAGLIKTTEKGMRFLDHYEEFQQFRGLPTKPLPKLEYSLLLRQEKTKEL